MYFSLYSFQSPWIEAALILGAGLLGSFLLHKFIIGWIFRTFGIENLLRKVFGHSTRIGGEPLPKVVGKSIAVFVFILSFRKAVEVVGYTEIEQFLDSVVTYLPHLFLALMIAYFGVQMSRTSYSLVYNAVHFENPRTAVILAHMARIVTLFFTVSIVISQINTGTIQIIPEYLFSSILIGFIFSVSLAFGLAFGLGGREAASQIIAEYLNRKNGEEKNLKNEK